MRKGVKKEISGYKNVIFLGTSSGGYAAILFGSLLNVNSVVAFTPQTVRLDKNIDEKYRDISQYINDSTNYYLYGDLNVKNEKDTHHISHCDRISHHPNVYIKRVAQFNLKTMRDNSELYGIFINLV
jgi:esterase/lipase